MVGPDDGAAEARPPRLTDLVALCRQLNEAHARYVVIGGMAMRLKSSAIMSISL